MITKRNCSIIAFEGLDCSFKETNYKRFLGHLIEMRGAYDDLSSYFSVHNASFPRYGHMSCGFVEGWLDNTFDREMLKENPEIRATFYSLDRFAYWYEKLEDGTRRIDLLCNGDNKFRYFVFDRYTLSNFIYNPKYPNDIDIRDLNFDNSKFKIPNPDIVVWFRMRSFDKLCELIAAKQEKDANELDIEYLRNVWERSEQIIASDIFAQAGIKLIVIECLDEEGNPRPRTELDWDVWSQVTSSVKYK